MEEGSSEGREGLEGRGGSGTPTCARSKACFPGSKEHSGSSHLLVSASHADVAHNQVDPLGLFPHYLE